MHLLNVINDILDISKIEAGETDLHESVFDLAETVTASIQMIRGQTDEPTDRVIQEGFSDLPRLYGDQRIIKQVILNLLSNSSKFTPSDRGILIIAKLTDQNKIVIRVIDEGSGIPKKDLDKVLTPFGQARSNAHITHDGTGLGLSLSKMLTELHGGTLEIESTLNVGTTVTLSFPSSRSIFP